MGMGDRHHFYKPDRTHLISDNWPRGSIEINYPITSSSTLS
jgi:hypothetical protein